MSDEPKKLGLKPFYLKNEARKATSYPDFRPVLAHEKLVEVHELDISISSVRALMIQEEVWVAKKAKEKRIYQLRGLIQMDGSPHDWFEGLLSVLYCIASMTLQGGLCQLF